MATMNLSRRVTVAVVLDVVAVVVFVIAGRRSHDETGSFVEGTARVAAPFLIGLAVGWLAAQGWKAPTVLRTALVVWVVAVATGLLLRRTLFDRGVALSFAIVTTLVLGVLLLGWRVLFNRSVKPA